MADKSKTTISFRALQLANEQRQAYGLRYNDLARYRKHCANRTHRLRSSLKITHGKGRDFKKLTPFNPDTLKEGHLQLLLFEAERAWAYAQELTNASLQPARADNASTLRHSATGRFRRAANWSTQLLSLCQTLYSISRLSVENLIEITIFTLILNGRFLRYRDDCEPALIQLSVARSLLDELAKTSPTSRDQALAILFSDEIGPEIRYCAHELGRSKAYDVSGIVLELAPKYRNAIVENCDSLLAKLKSEDQSTSSSSLTERLWEQQPVPVRYPELVDVLLKVQTAELALNSAENDLRHPSSVGKKSKLGVTAYDEILSTLSDAEEVARKLKESQQLDGSSTNPSTTARDIHFVYAYIVYQLLSRRIQRDMLLMNTLLASGRSQKSKIQHHSKPASRTNKEVDSRLHPAIVKLLDTVLQSLTQMRTLSIVDDNQNLSLAIDGRLAFTNARRCLYLARCYSAVDRYAEALVLLQHATIHIRESNSCLSLLEPDSINDSSPPFFVLNNMEVKDLEGFVLSDGLEYKRDWLAYNGGSVNADHTTYKKPLFFNIALNYVELDMDQLQLRAGNEPTSISTDIGSTAEELKTDPSSNKRQVLKSKAEEHIVATATPELQQPARGALSSLLGGWWSKR